MSGFIGAESTAVFAHVSWDLNEDWTLDFGARWTDEDRTFNQVELQTVPETCSFGQPGDPDPTTFCQPEYVLNFDSVFIDGFYNDTSANFSETTPMVTLTRNLENGMVYGLIAEGFLSGAFNDELNTNLVPELSPLLTYQPEHVTNYEVGYKGSFADGRVQIAGDVFWMDYEDKQEQINIDNADGRFGGDPQVGIVTNAATVDIVGIEFELRASLWDGGFLSVDLGYLDADYGAFESFDPDAPGGTVDLSNLTIADYAPEWTINATIEHAFQLGNGATLTPQLGVYWQDDYDFVGALDASMNERSVCFTPAYAKLRTRITYVPAVGNWQASLFGKNINDERYNEWCDEGRSGTYLIRYGRPDTWGLEFTYRWGAGST
jgi:iron complex outermembrane receptor protein